MCAFITRARAKKSDDRHCRLLRPRRQRPRRRAAEKRDESAARHSITMILSSPAHALEAQFFSV
jgi:hypothetical protein